jgi:replicative DNA helicase
MSTSGECLTLVNLPTERAVLGACIESEELLGEAIAAGLTADDFALSDHRKVFSTILRMREKNVPVDFLSVADWLGNHAQSYALVGSLTDGVVLQRDHTLYHASVVIKKSRLRNLAKLGEWIINSVNQEGADPQCLVTEMEARLGRL